MLMLAWLAGGCVAAIGCKCMRCSMQLAAGMKTQRMAGKCVHHSIVYVMANQ